MLEADPRRVRKLRITLSQHPALRNDAGRDDAGAKPATGLSGLAGWRALLFAFAAGAISATGLRAAGIFSGDACWAMPRWCCCWMAPRRRPGVCAAPRWLGWAFFFGQFLIGLHWIVYPFLVDPDANLWQLPFAPVASGRAGVCLARLAAGLAMLFLARTARARILVFAILMASSEWLRGHVLTGFPWNLPAYGWGASLALLQSAGLMGAYGLSFLTILLGASLAELASRTLAHCPSLMLLLFAGLWSYGVYRLDATPTRQRGGCTAAAGATGHSAG